MDMDDDACYRALQTRDARFDGRLFVAVRTTGIYCRPICPARTPKRKSCTFYPSAAAAQEAGFRPCLRCRPETSPELAMWRGTSKTVSRALALIDTSALDEPMWGRWRHGSGSASVSYVACFASISGHRTLPWRKPGGSCSQSSSSMRRGCQ